MSEDPRAKRIAIIGEGRLGSTLAVALAYAGFQATKVSSRARSEAQAVLGRADLAFLTVPDGAIAEVCAGLTWTPDHAVVYCSGALGLGVLDHARAAGAAVGCFHPLQTFPAGVPDPQRFLDITVGVEAAVPLAATLEGIARTLGANVVRLEGIDRALYHAAAVVVSNDAVALMAAAIRVWELSGLPEEPAREALSTLLSGAAESLRGRDPSEAITGPVARGDIATVARNLDALRVDADLYELYRRLALELLRIPLKHTPEVTAQLHALLRDPLV